jgi:hypothetical protein
MFQTRASESERPGETKKQRDRQTDTERKRETD